MTQEEIEEIRIQAKEQRAKGNWHDAVALYEKIYFPQCDRWLAWEYSDCLKKLSRIDDAILISKELYQRDGYFYYNNNFLSWLLYEKYFRHLKDDYNYQELSRLYEIAISITTFTVQDNKSAYERSIIQMLRLLRKYGNNPFLKILTLLSKLDVQKLSEEAGKYEQDGIKKEYQSNKEMYYSMKSKALLDAEHYVDCISCCDEALLSLKQFHHDNKVWIITRKAMSMAKMGDHDKGIAELQKAVVNKNHWSLFEKIAKIYLMKQDSQNALLYFSRAAISHDPPKMKVSLYMDIANLLISMDDEKNAWKHLLFTWEIRQKEQWNIPFQIQQLYQQLSINHFDETVQLYQLKEYWLNVIYRKLGKHSGEISKINAGGKTGFILSEGKSYYFRALSFIESPRFKERDKVVFCLIESFDIKKQQSSLECGYIKFDIN